MALTYRLFPHVPLHAWAVDPGDRPRLFTPTYSRNEGAFACERFNDARAGLKSRFVLDLMAPCLPVSWVWCPPWSDCDRPWSAAFPDEEVCFVLTYCIIARAVRMTRIAAETQETKVASRMRGNMVNTGVSIRPNQTSLGPLGSPSQLSWAVFILTCLTGYLRNNVRWGPMFSVTRRSENELSGGLSVRM